MLLDMARCFVASAPGTGSSIALGTFVPGYQTLTAAGAVNFAVFNYNITDYDGVAAPGLPYGSETGWEVGSITYSSAGPSLTGRTPLFSSNGNLAINASANAHVWATPLATDFLTVDTVATGVVAAGSGQSDATALTAQFNEVISVATDAGVRIPNFMLAPGQRCRIASYGANTLLVWPLNGQSFMSGGVSNGVNEPLKVPVGTVLDLETSAAATVYSVP